MLYNWIPPVFHIGPLTFRVYGVAVAAAILVGWLVATRLAKSRGISPDLVTDISLVAVVGGVVGARLVYVAFDLPAYLSDPIRILLLNEGGLSFHGAIAGGVVASYLYLRRKPYRFWEIADVFAPALALGEAVGRIGCDVYGRPTEFAPFALLVDGQRYHNVPLYTSVTSLAVFALLWAMKDRWRDGRLFWAFIMLYSVARFFIEFARDSVTWGFVSVAQIASVILIAAAVLSMNRCHSATK